MDTEQNEIRSTIIYGYNIENKTIYALSMRDKKFCEYELTFELYKALSYHTVFGSSETTEVRQPSDETLKCIRQLHYQTPLTKAKSTVFRFSAVQSGFSSAAN